jgi:hypothetical protein
MSKSFYPSRGFGSEGPHPQFSILRKHIDRAVQDLFLSALRNPSEELNYVFRTEDQIDSFTQRMIQYWESHEDYEICAEIQKLGRNFKREWKEKSTPDDFEPKKIIDIFK